MLTLKLLEDFFLFISIFLYGNKKILLPKSLEIREKNLLLKKVTKPKYQVPQTNFFLIK